MEGVSVTIFRYYPFVVGQRIRIEGGKRQGDWEVVGISDTKVTLRCPISDRRFEWNRFCYSVEERENDTWPSTSDEE
jgi:hypothetical protein